MATRELALNWYEGKFGIQNAMIFASKYYKAGESWTASPVWWIELPLETLNSNLGKSIHLLCQKPEDETDFYHLKFPAYFIIQNLKKLELNKDRVSLFLSAEKRNIFVELRSKSNLNFAPFIVM